jgi:hypothetical protein
MNESKVHNVWFERGNRARGFNCALPYGGNLSCDQGCDLAVRLHYQHVEGQGTSHLTLYLFYSPCGGFQQTWLIPSSAGVPEFNVDQGEAGVVRVHFVVEPSDEVVLEIWV